MALTGAVASPVSLGWATADGTATAGADYVAVPDGTLTFRPGAALLQEVEVATLDDDLPEEAETFTGDAHRDEPSGRRDAGGGRRHGDHPRRRSTRPRERRRSWRHAGDRHRNGARDHDLRAGWNPRRTSTTSSSRYVPRAP